MKKTILYLTGLGIVFSLQAQETSYAEYLKSFSYEERKAMKIDSVELTVLLEEGKVQLVDIRFKEEYAAWHMPYAINIPLNELPVRLNELDKSKLIVTACPHKDRAIMARTFLRLKGYKTCYLKDGLLGLADFLRGDNAKEFIDGLPKPK